MAVDYWSIGCILHAITTNGTPPFHSASEALTVKSIMDYSRDATNDLFSMTGSNVCPSEWEKDIVALLQVEVQQRMRAWKAFSASVKEKGFSDNQDILLPIPSWQGQVESTRLKDGALGWSVFML